MRNIFVLLLTALIILFQPAISQAATEIGSVVAVAGSPSASGPGGNRALKAGSAVYEDDKITVRSGNAQILLRDNTRLVVGPGSSLVLDQFVMKGGNSAQKVSIQALRGTFRFITGRSKKSAYAIRTSNATIGIRGTGFDFWVKQKTGVAVLQGTVKLCAGKSCTTLSSNCDVGIAGGGKATELQGSFAASGIATNLPYIKNQSPLRTAFRLPTNKCFAKRGNVNEGSRDQFRKKSPTDRPPENPEPPTPEPPPPVEPPPVEPPTDNPRLPPGGKN